MQNIFLTSCSCTRYRDLVFQLIPNQFTAAVTLKVGKTRERSWICRNYRRQLSISRRNMHGIHVIALRHTDSQTCNSIHRCPWHADHVEARNLAINLPSITPEILAMLTDFCCRPIRIQMIPMNGMCVTYPGSQREAGNYFALVYTWLFHHDSLWDEVLLGIASNWFCTTVWPLGTELLLLEERCERRVHECWFIGRSSGNWRYGCGRGSPLQILIPSHKTRRVLKLWAYDQLPVAILIACQQRKKTVLKTSGRPCRIRTRCALTWSHRHMLWPCNSLLSTVFCNAVRKRHITTRVLWRNHTYWQVEQVIEVCESWRRMRLMTQAMRLTCRGTTVCWVCIAAI